MTLISSNPTKIKEFKSFFGNTIDIEAGRDIKEVLGTMDEVIQHKALQAGEGYVVEDTILFVNDVEIVDIRWRLDDLKEGDVAKWITSLGYNDGKNIIVYRGTIDGVITTTRGSEGFAFDPYFIPSQLLGNDQFIGKDHPLANKTLHELGDKKHHFSARVNAMYDLMHHRPAYEIAIIDIKPWTGEYQGS